MLINWESVNLMRNRVVFVATPEQDVDSANKVYADQLMDPTMSLANNITPRIDMLDENVERSIINSNCNYNVCQHKHLRRNTVQLLAMSP
jgi:hypothetical protein